jgi:hypothetical protein
MGLVFLFGVTVPDLDFTLVIVVKQIMAIID